MAAITLLYWGCSELAHPGPIFRADPNAGVPVLADVFIYLNTCGNIAGTIYTGRSLRLQREDLAKKLLKQQQQQQPQLKASLAAPTISAKHLRLAASVAPALSTPSLDSKSSDAGTGHRPLISKRQQLGPLDSSAAPDSQATAAVALPNAATDV